MGKAVELGTADKGLQESQGRKRWAQRMGPAGRGLPGKKCCGRLGRAVAVAGRESNRGAVQRGQEVGRSPNKDPGG